MDVVHSLIRQVVRGFYDVRAVLIVDALLMHHVLSDRELSTLIGIPAKDMRAICARLKDDHLIQDASRKEETAGSYQRNFVQTFYYIHFTEAVDAIKWKMHFIENKLREEMDAQHNPQDWVCDVCKTRYNVLDAVSLLDPMENIFKCEVCGNQLREDEGPPTEEGSSAQDKMEGLMVQLKPLIGILKKIDDLSIPENTFDSELNQAIPLPSPEPEQPTGAGITPQQPAKGDDLVVAGSAASRLPQAVQSSFQVHITSDGEQAAQEASQQREKQRLKEENALPEWHRASTVESKGSTVKRDPDAVKPELTSAEEKPNEGTNVENEMDEFYRKLEAQQQDQPEEEAEDDDFQDIDV